MADALNRIAADESFRTTDGNDTNIADLMQSGLLNIVNALENLPSYSAGNITYDNSTSGLAATDVKDALDELASEKADASNVYTKAQTDAKIEALDYDDTAVSGSYVTEVDETDGVISVTREAADSSPTSGSKKMVTSGGVYAELSALNDALTQRMTYEDNSILGAKNLLPMVLSDIKSYNTSGTWSDNVYTLYGVDFTVNTDDDGNVISIGINGTSTNVAALLLKDSYTLASGSYKLNGANGGSNAEKFIRIGNASDNSYVVSDVGSGASFSLSADTELNCRVMIGSGVTVSSLTFYPMIRLATDTDSTFQPYAMTNLQLTSKVNAMAELYHNIPRLVPKDITDYVTDGSIWDRLNGTNGYSFLEDLYVGDYFKMSRAISAYEQTQQYQATGSLYVTIAGINSLMGNGSTAVSVNHLVMVPGQGFGGTQHFGRSRMNSSNTTEGGYIATEMHTTTLGAVTSTGSTESTATINEQLYAEFGSHLLTTYELLTNAINSSGYNRFGANTGCSSGNEWAACQSVLMSEIEWFGSIVWSSAGYDTGNANHQLPLFANNKQAINNRVGFFWLKDIASARYFCAKYYTGYSDYNGASRADYYVRPRFVLCA